MVTILLGCDKGRPDPPPAAREPEKPVEVKEAARSDPPEKQVARKGDAEFEISIEEIAVDRPIYPVPRNFRPRKDAQAIMEDVERTVRRELARITACVSEPKLAAIGVGWKIAPGGRAVDAHAHASLTSPGQDPVRDKCIADVIGTIVFSPPGRVAPIELGLWIKPDD